MNDRGLVEVPENAIRDEPIAFGLTGVQLGICGAAVLVAAVINLLPVWEVARVFRQLDLAGDELLSTTAELTGLTMQQIHIALRYYAAFPEEIDAWIERIDEEADRAKQAWLREQALIQR